MSDKSDFLLIVVLFVLYTLSISLFYENTVLLTSLFVFYSIVTIVLRYRKQDLYLYFIGVIGGFVMEIFIVNSTAWQYSNPTFFGVPLWTPLGWGMTVVLIRKFSDIFVKIVK